MIPTRIIMDISEAGELRAVMIQAETDKHQRTAERVIMELQALIRRQSSDTCLICSGAPAIVGIFQPDDPAAWGAGNGKGRMFRYCLCATCQAKPDTPERVEKIIRHELQTGGLTYGK
jgi:hypothetical protein